MIRLSAPAHRAAELTLTATVARADPWGEIRVDALMTAADGSSLRVPAFWDGGATWRVRLSAAVPGTWRIRTECSDPGDRGLHGQEAVLEVGPPQDGSRLHRHGAVRIRSDGRRFEHADGTPFHWFGDTWWMQMSERVAWPEDFQRLTAHRVAQGFNLVQVVVGFPPDLPPLDPQGRDGNAGGSPWEAEYRRINPAYFQACDRRLAHLVDAGLVPCILASWGYHLGFMGAARMASHWRYLVARYAAWPVIWCLAGEGAMPYYLAKDGAGDSERQKAAWPDIARAVRACDPWHRPLTLHPRQRSWDDTADPATLDFHMLQAGHMGLALQHHVDAMAAGRERDRDGILIQGEPPYEGHGGCNGPDVQRYAYWSAMLGGCTGFTYGAVGIFQANDRARPTGVKPGGGAYDGETWDEGLRLPGAEQLAAGHRLLTSLPLHRFETHPEWAELILPWGHENYRPAYRVFAAGVPGECRVVYLPIRFYHWDGPLIRHLEPGVRYRVDYIEPATMVRHDAGSAAGDAQGCWRGPPVPFMRDWLVLMQRC